MKNTRSFASLALTCLFFAISAACAGAEPANTPNKPGAISGQSGFVKVQGRHLRLDGKPYYFAGTNLWYGMYLGSPGKTGDLSLIHISEPTRLLSISYAVFCLKKK